MEAEFKVIGITIPGNMDSAAIEGRQISEFLSPGGNFDRFKDLALPFNPVDYFHIRKPDSDEKYVVELIESIPSHLHSRLILHSHYNLFFNYDFGGIHIKENCSVPADFIGTLIKTKSCHNLDELTGSADDDFSYFFLSPIFDSISKYGYKAAFSLNDRRLLSVNSKNNVIGLGGVKPEFFRKLFEAKFAGAALLGYLWSPNESLKEKIDHLVYARLKLR